MNTSGDDRTLIYRWEVVKAADGTMKPRLAGEGSTGKIAVFTCINDLYMQKYADNQEGVPDADKKCLQIYPRHFGLKMSKTNECASYKDEIAVIEDFDEMGAFGEICGAAVKTAKLAWQDNSGRKRGSYFIALELHLQEVHTEAEGAALNLLCADKVGDELGFSIRHAYILLHTMWMDILHVYENTNEKIPVEAPQNTAPTKEGGSKKRRDESGPSRIPGPPADPEPEEKYHGYLMLDIKNGNFIYSKVQSGTPPYFKGENPDPLRQYVHIMATDYGGFAREGYVVPDGTTFRSPGNNPPDHLRVKCTKTGIMLPVSDSKDDVFMAPVKNNAQHVAYQLAVNYFDFVVPKGFEVSAAAVTTVTEAGTIIGRQNTHATRVLMGNKIRTAMMKWFSSTGEAILEGRNGNRECPEYKEFQAIKNLLEQLSGVNTKGPDPAFLDDKSNPIKTVANIQAKFDEVNALIKYVPMRYSPYGSSTITGYQPWQSKKDAVMSGRWGRPNHPGWTSFDAAYTVITGLPFGDDEATYRACKDTMPHVAKFENTRYWYQGPHSECQCACQCKRMRIADGFDQEVDEPLYVIGPKTDTRPELDYAMVHGVSTAPRAVRTRRAATIVDGRYYIVCKKCAAAYEDYARPGVCVRGPNAVDDEDDPVAEEDETLDIQGMKIDTGTETEEEGDPEHSDDFGSGDDSVSESAS